MVDPVEVTRELRTAVTVDQHVAGGGDRLGDFDIPPLGRDRSLDVQDCVERQTGSIRRATEGQSGQGRRQIEPAGADDTIERTPRRTEGEGTGRRDDWISGPAPVGVKEGQQDVRRAGCHRRTGLETKGGNVLKVDVGSGGRAREFDRAGSREDGAAQEDDRPGLGARGAGQLDAAADTGRSEEIIGASETDALSAGVTGGDGTAGAGDMDGRRARGR